MITILLHSSKTMRHPAVAKHDYRAPALLSQARELMNHLQLLSAESLASCMHLSPKKAVETKEILATWSASPTLSIAAIDAFIGDIYSGLQVSSFTESDRKYADSHLAILSGLYGVLRPLDTICPYRLEMGYKIPGMNHKNLYEFWAGDIAKQIQPGTIINVSSVEYTKSVLPHLKDRKIITPKFLTKDSKTKEPKFVVVHAKIARGAFAHWLIKNKVTDSSALKEFNELGYSYVADASTIEQPVFMCQPFEGLGLSVRRTTTK